MTLAWHPVSGTGISYIVYLDTSTNRPRTQVDTTGDTSVTVSVKVNKTWFWRIEACQGNRISYGDVWQFTADTTSINRPPVFAQDAIDMLGSATVGKLYKDTVFATDPDGDTVKFAFIDSVAGMILSKGIIT